MTDNKPSGSIPPPPPMPEAAASTSKPSSANSNTSSSSKAPLAPPPKFDPSSIKIPSTPTLPPSTKAKIDLKNLPKPPPLPTKASTRPPAPSASNTDSNAEKKPIDTSSIAANKHVPISQSSNASKKKAKEFATHSLKEDIPTLDSAPSSIHGEMTAQTNLDDEEPTIPHHPKRNIHFTKQPPHHLLTYAQRSIPILVVPTDEAKAISEKNNLSLTDMLNGMANSIMREMTTSSSGNSGGNNMPSLGKLPPIRSVNRMIHLKWDMISLQFVEKFGYPNDDSSSKEKDVEWEERLKYASELWSDEETVSSLEDTIESLLHSKPMEKDYTTFDIDQDAKVEEDERRRHEKGFDLLSHFRTPWYARFRNGINQQTSHQPFSMMHCPPVVLYVASSAEGIDGLEDLLTENANLLPEEYKNGLFDPNGMREHFLIMHDEKDGPDNQHFQEVQVLQEMRNRFGPGCAAVVRVNSGVPSSNTKEDIIWDECLIPSTPKSHFEFTKEVHRIRGGFLSSQDKLSLRRFMSHMVTSVVIPAIEKRIYDLNVEVTNHKKGVKNLFKSFMRKPRDGSLSGSMHGGSSVRSVYSNPGTDGSTSTGTNGVPYTYKSIESQTRLLADTLFLIRDYEGALSMYRLVKDDYKHDQNLLHNASVHEMMALSIYLTDLATGYRSTREIITHIETALALYSNAAEEERRKSGGSRPQVAPIATRCVTRLCLLMSAVRMLCEHRDMETADNLASASSNETPLGAAILLEQSSGHYFRAGMIRKYAFHVLMAGHMFRSAGQEYHAVRCFASALHVYNCGDRFWPELFNHLMSALAGQLYGMKRMKSGLQLYAKLVGTTGGGRVSVRSQQKFLDHLVTICRAYEVDALESSVRIKSKHYGDNLNDWQEVEEVLKHTPNARRVLEILNMGLPHVDDLSVKFEDSCHIRNPSDNVKSPMMFGKNSDGSDEKWQDLTCHAEAELRIHQKQKNLSPKEFNRLVLDEVDEEKKKLQTQLRRKKQSKKPIERRTRAKLEPISVSFDLSNPLSILVPISSIQIIARLTCEKTHRVYTNVESIDIAGSDDHEKKQKKWKFAGSDKFFEIADFSRISPSTDAETENWISGAADEIDPYFLVSKGRIAMEPRSTSTVSLELCPLVMGELEIIGIRCKIFNEIWVSHNFPSLDANLSAGVSSNLKSKIVCDMPNITVDVVRRDEDIGHNRVVLQGQVGKWVMRVANQGAAHATNLFLKTNVPWINICHDGDVTENAEVSNCIGPSGTMMQLPIQNASDNTKNTIAPGETIDIPIDIRTSGGGKQEFYMLFRYELFEKATSSKQKSLSPKVRWFKKMVSVPVYPSLTLTASLTPSFLNKKESILSVEMTNYRSDKDTDLEMFVKNITAASKKYVIKPFTIRDDKATEHNKLQTLDGHPISWQEQAVLHYTVSPINQESNCTLSHCYPGTANGEDEISLAVTDFICLENAHEKFHQNLETRERIRARQESEQEQQNQGPRSIAQIRRARSQLSTGSTDDGEEASSLVHPTSRSMLCSGEELNIICSWRTIGENPADIIEGQHHLRQLIVRPQTQSKSCPLLIGAKYRDNIQHDFSTGPLHVDVELSIRNRLVQSPVKFEFSLEPRKDITFFGIETFEKILEGGEEITFPLDAVISESGMYNLQSVKLTVFNESEHTKIPYIFPLQWVLKVNA